MNPNSSFAKLRIASRFVAGSDRPVGVIATFLAEPGLEHKEISPISSRCMEILLKDRSVIHAT